MSMDVNGASMLLVAVKKGDIQKRKIDRVKEFKKLINEIPDERFDSLFQNFLEDNTSLVGRYFDEDERCCIKVNYNIGARIIYDFELAEGAGSSDGHDLRNLFKEKAEYCIYDENVKSDEPPYVTFEGEKDSFHLSYCNYGDFYYLMKPETFNDNIEKIEEYSWRHNETPLQKITKEVCISYFNKAIQSFKELNTDWEKSYLSANYHSVEDKEYSDIKKYYEETINLKAEDFDFYVKFIGYVC